MFGLGGNGIVTAIGVVYPTLCSFLALDPKAEKGEDKQWLTYWVIFGLFNIADYFTGFILSWIPFYYFLKLMFLVFLMHPYSKGATKVFEWFIKPNLGQIDEIREQVERVSGQLGTRRRR